MGEEPGLDLIQLAQLPRLLLELALGRLQAGSSFGDESLQRLRVAQGRPQAPGEARTAEKQDSHDNQCAEGHGLAKPRSQSQRQHGLSRTPNSVLVGGEQAKPILARREVSVDGAALALDLDPIWIEALELVAKAHPIWTAQGRGGEMELEAAGPRRDYQFAGDRSRPAVDHYFFDHSRQRHGVALDLRRIDRDSAAHGGEPEPSQVVSP